MDQLARLVTVFDQDGAQQLVKSLNAVEKESKAAEVATENLTDATKQANAAMNASAGAHAKAASGISAIRTANDNAARSSKAMTQATLNLSRQLSDVGVTAAMGMNPLMILIQQGPQIADAFQQASAGGLGFSAVLKGIWVQAAPLLAVIAPIAIAVGAVASAFAIAAKEINDDNKNIAASMGLTAAQLEKVKDKTVTMTDVMKGTWNAAAKAFAATFKDEIKAVDKFFSDFYRGFVDGAVSAIKLHVGYFVGGYKAVVDTWKMLPAAIGDLTVQAVNATISGIEFMANKAVQAVNMVIDGVNRALVAAGMPPMGRLGNVGLGRLENRWAGAAQNTGNQVMKSFAAGLREGAAAVDTAFAAIEKESILAAQKRIRKEAGKAGKGAKNTATQAELAKAAAMRDGRYATGSVNRDVKSISVVDVGDYSNSITPYKPLRDNTINGDPAILSAEQASKRLADIQKQRARDRLDTEKAMWDGLTALSSSGNKKLAAIGRAAAIAEATIDGIKAVQKAYASLPFPFNLAAAATMAGLTAINVARIAGVKGFAAGGYTGNGGIGQVAGAVHGQEFVVNAAATRQNRATLEAMNAGRAIPKNPANSNSRSGTRVTVVKGDLFDAIIEENARRVAAPMADKAREDGAHQGAQTAADQYVRHNIKRLA